MRITHFRVYAYPEGITFTEGELALLTSFRLRHRLGTASREGNYDLFWYVRNCEVFDRDVEMLRSLK